MQVAYDVNFLIQPDVSRSVIYRYRTGVLIPQMRAVIETELAIRGEALRALEPNEIGTALFGSSLFEQFVGFCKWPLRASRDMARHREMLVAGLTQTDAKKVVVFADFDDPVFQHPGWSDAARHCNVVDEPTVTAETAPHVLRTFWSMTDLPFCILDETVISNLLAFAVTPDLNLGAFLDRVSVHLIVDYDEETGTFSLSDLAGDENIGRSEMLRPLRRLVDQRQSAAVDELVASTAVRLHDKAWSVDELCRDILRAARELLKEQDPKAGKEPDAAVLRRRLILSAAVLVAARRVEAIDGRARDLLGPHPEPALAEFERLYRDCHRRLTLAANLDPLTDWWSEIRTVLAGFAEFRPKRWLTQEERLIGSMSEALKNVNQLSSVPGWIRRLALLINSAAELRQQREREFSEATSTST